MKKRIEPVSSIHAALAIGDLVAVTGGAPSGRYTGHVPGGRQASPQVGHGHGRPEAPPVNGPNRPYQPGGGRDNLLPPSNGTFTSSTQSQRNLYGWTS